MKNVQDLFLVIGMKMLVEACLPCWLLVFELSPLRPPKWETSLLVRILDEVKKGRIQDVSFF